MKNIIKKINLFAIVAMLIGGGFAFATVNDDPEPNVYPHPTLPNAWLPLEGMQKGVDFECVGNTNTCTAYLDPSNPQAEPEIIDKGNFRIKSK